MDGLNRIAGPMTALPPSLERTLGPNSSPEAVGRGFEGMFASMLIKHMRETLDSDTMFGNDTGGVVSGMFDHFLGEHIARSGGLGVGAMIRRQLEQREALQQGSSVQ